MSHVKDKYLVVCVSTDEPSVEMLRSVLRDYSDEYRIEVLDVCDALCFLVAHPATVFIIDLDNLPPYQRHLDNILFEQAAEVPTIFLSANHALLDHPALPAFKHYVTKPVVRQALQLELCRVLACAALSGCGALDILRRTRPDSAPGANQEEGQIAPEVTS